MLSAAARPAPASADETAAISDGTIFNFAPNLEYLEAESYSYAVTGHGLPDNLTYGMGQRGPVVGGREVPFRSRSIRQFAAADIMGALVNRRSTTAVTGPSRP